jgi:hypothetical protein
VRLAQAELTSGNVVRARTVVVASGAAIAGRQSRTLPSSKAPAFLIGPLPWKRSSARVRRFRARRRRQFGGQAVVYLAPKVKYLHLVVRGAAQARMSQYLIDRIKALPNVELHTNTEIVGLEGDRVAASAVRVPLPPDRRDARLRAPPPLPVHRRRSQCRLAPGLRSSRRQGLRGHWH